MAVENVYTRRIAEPWLSTVKQLYPNIKQHPDVLHKTFGDIEQMKAFDEEAILSIIIKDDISLV